MHHHISQNIAKESLLVSWVSLDAGQLMICIRLIRSAFCVALQDLNFGNDKVCTAF